MIAPDVVAPQIAAGILIFAGLYLGYVGLRALGGRSFGLVVREKAVPLSGPAGRAFGALLLLAAALLIAVGFHLPLDYR